MLAHQTQTDQCWLSTTHPHRPLSPSESATAFPSFPPLRSAPPLVSSSGQTVAKAPAQMEVATQKRTLGRTWNGKVLHSHPLLHARPLLHTLPCYTQVPSSECTWKGKV